MGYECNFLSNKIYTAEDVNKAFSRLTTQGVSLFADTGQPLVDLNAAVANLATGGVELYNMNACKVVKTGTGAYKVLPGTAFMPQGQAITVDADGYGFTADVGTVYNVVMFAEANAGAIEARTGAPPANGILIAVIAADGTVSDLRTFAKAKVAPATNNISQSITESIHFTPDGTEYDFDVGWGGFQYALCQENLGFVQLEEGAAKNLFVTSHNWCNITKNGASVNIRALANSGYTGTKTVTILFI